MKASIRLGLATALAVGASSAAGSSASAQTRLIPQVGLYSAVDDLGTVEGLSGAYQVGRYESTLAYGAALEFGAGRGLSFRVGGLYAPDATVPLSGIGCDPRCPAGVDLLSLNGALVLRPLGRILLIEPYAIGGGGIKRFDFEPEVLDDGIGRLFTDDSDWAGLLGIGAELDLGGTAFTFELTNHFHWADPQLPGEDRGRIDDFFFTVGLVLGGR